MYGQSASPQGTGLYGYGFVLGAYSGENMGASGTKSAVGPLPDNRVVALYAMESPEVWFEDFGSSQLRDGVAQAALASRATSPPAMP